MLIEDGRIDGWSPVWYLGAPLFLFQSYGYYFAQALVPLAVGKVAPEYVETAAAWAVRAAPIVPIVCLPAVSYRLARRMGTGRIGAVIASWVALCISTDTGYGAMAAFHVGLELHSVGILFVGIVLPELVDPPAWRDRRFYVVALAIGLALVTHLISGAHLMVAAIFFGSWQALAQKRSAPLTRALGIIALALLLSGHALFPAIELHHLMGPSVGWGWRERLADIVALGHFGPPTLTAVAIAGLMYSLAVGTRTHATCESSRSTTPNAPKAPDRVSAAARRMRIAWFAVALFVAGATPRIWAPVTAARIALDVLQPRALAVVALLLPAYAGYAAECVLAGARNRSRTAAAVVVIGTLWLAAVTTNGFLEVRRLVTSAGTLEGRQTAQCADLLRWLREHGHPGAVVAWENHVLTAEDCATESIASLVHLETGLFTLSGDQAELTRVQRRHVLAAGTRRMPSPAALARHVERYRLTYIVVRSPELAGRLEETGMVKPAARFEELTILERNGPALALIGDGLRVHRESLARSRAAWLVESTHGALATLAISYHPAWRAHLDGRPLKLQRTLDGLMAVAIPPGIHVLRAVFDRRPVERLYYAASGVALLTIAAGILAGRRG